MSTDARVMELLGETKKLAKEYYALTRKPLGIICEVAEYEAARLLGVTLTPAQQTGYDATERTNNSLKKIQIKGRCLQAKGTPGQRLSGIQLEKDWDKVLMVLLDGNFDATEIYEADRDAIEKTLTAPHSRHERGMLSVSKFKSIGKLRWSNGATPIGKRKRTVNNMGVGRWCMEQIKSHPKKANSQIALEARERFTSNTTPDCVDWYRSQLRRDQIEAEA